MPAVDQRFLMQCGPSATSATASMISEDRPATASTIVAEVLTGLVRRSDDSILRAPGWAPTLPAATPGRFDLADLLRFARVLPS